MKKLIAFLLALCLCGSLLLACSTPDDPVVPKDPVDPGEDDPVDPGEDDPVDPGENDPVDPGENDPVDPGEDDPVEPSDPAEPSDPVEPSDPAEPSDPEEPKINEENVIMQPLTNYVSDEEYARAIRANNKTDVTMLQSVMNRAKRGEDITVAVIGGSITGGSSASNDESTYASAFRNWWRDTFPESKVTLVNAGIGATGSYYGVHRVDEHVIAKSPDVCIVEFSVNDSNNVNNRAAYQSLVAKLLDKGIATMLLFMVQESGESVQAMHMSIGVQYQVPMISYGDAIYPTIKSGERAWRDISPDDIHPNDYGHAYAGELIWRYLNDVYAYCPNEVTVKQYDSEELQATAYYHAKMMMPFEAEDAELWEPEVDEGFWEDKGFQNYFVEGAYAGMAYSEEDAAVLEFTGTFEKLGAVYLRTADGQSCSCKVYVDDMENPVATLNGDFPGGFRFAHVVSLYSGRQSEEHTVRFVVEDPYRTFTLIRLLVVE